ncbi:DUF1127 domain-containing protein [Mesorhizobium sp. INR15]|nr:DUF1127 domain-containing protein [Mesorhizobium sp. INR15]
MHHHHAATPRLASPIRADTPAIQASPNIKRLPRAAIVAMASWISLQLERRRSRRALLEMSDEQLKDIGLSRGEAYSESVRRLWD